MGSRVPPTESFGRQNADRERAERNVRDALRFDGSQFVRLYEKMQALIANLTATVTGLVADALAGVISPGGVTTTGNVSAVNVTATGRVTSAAALRSPGSYVYSVSSNYFAAWMNDDGTFGRSPSTRTLKKNLTSMHDLSPAGVDAADAVLGLEAYWGHYVWDEDDAPLKSFLIAEDVHAAGFGPDVAPLEDGKPASVNYSQLIPALLAALQAEVRRGIARDTLIESLRHPAPH